MNWRRLPIEVESPEQAGYETIACNLAESSVADRTLGEVAASGLGDLVLRYGDHVGHRDLRALIAEDAGPGVGPDDVLVTAGAAAALFIVNTSLLSPGARIVVARPNYATNVETPRALGAEVATIDERMEERWRLDLDRLAALALPGTRLLSLTSPGNPTGRVIPEVDVERAIRLAEERGAILLFDETYRDLRFEARPPPPLAAARSARAVSVSSLSKAWGLPGIRIGWLVCRDRALMRIFLAAKEQISISNSVLDEEVAFRALSRRAEWIPRLRAHVAARLEIVRAWIGEEPRLEWIEPEGGVVCFPRVRPEVEIDMDRFYTVLRERYRTWVGPGHWFEMDRRHFRIGFGWPAIEELKKGLANVSRALSEAMRG